MASNPEPNPPRNRPTPVARISERTVNDVLGQLLRAKNIRWKDSIDTEKTGVLSEDARKRPDIVVNHPGGVPVIIESEFDPARSVEKDAQARLQSSLSSDGRKIEQTIALRLPASLAESDQGQLSQTLESTNFKYCLIQKFSKEDSFAVRWPERGWIEGNIDDFAGFIEQTALSESIIGQGMKVLELRISQATYIVRNYSDPSADTNREISNLLNQKDGEQTTRMAMAILANAISFHNTIAKVHKVKPIEEIKDTFGKFCRTRLYEEWNYILREINYWPIFEIASELLLSMQPRIGH